MDRELPADIRERAAGDFGEHNADEVIEYLWSRIPERMPNSTQPRRFRCILHIAEGDRRRLEHGIELCLSDPRDVILTAEYEDRDGRHIRMWDFSQPFSEAAIQQAGSA